MKTDCLVPTLRSIIQTGQNGGWKYILSDDVLFHIPLEMAPRNAAVSQWWTFEQHVDGEWYMRIRKGYAWDGSTYSPDFSKGVTSLQTVLAVLNASGHAAALSLCGPLLGSILHDAVYQFVLEIALSQKSGKWKTLTWGDRMFKAIMLACGTPAKQAKIYHAVVSWIGHPLNLIWRNTAWMRLWTVLLACASLSGCQTPVAVKPATDAALAYEGRTVRAVTVGLNRVDPAKWGGWSGPLSDCEFDAELWHETWRDIGYQSTNLLTEAATVANVRGALEWGIDGMRAGDLLIVEISGHGGQGPDSEGEGADGRGEYLCLFDGPLSDNTINRWLRSVPPGVFILWGADTCHSGTMYRTPKRFTRRATSGFLGELILLAGASENSYSLSTGNGGMWSNARQATGPTGMTPLTWFIAAKALVPPDKQIPVYAEYGEVSDAFRNMILAPTEGK